MKILNCYLRKCEILNLKYLKILFLLLKVKCVLVQLQYAYQGHPDFVTVNDNESIPYEYRSFHNYIKYLLFFISENLEIIESIINGVSLFGTPLSIVCK